MPDTDRARTAAEHVALVTLALASAKFVVKLATAVSTGSLGLASTAVESGLDLVLAIIVIVGVRFAQRPADAEHPYGHGKFENVAGVFEAGILAGAGVILGFLAFDRLRDPEIVSLEPWVLVALGAVIVVDIERVWKLTRTSRSERSPALAVDAWHFLADLIATTGALAGAWLASRGMARADGVGALIVAGVLVAGSFVAGWHAFGGLVDRTPRGLTGRVREAIEEVEHVTGTPNVRVRGAGQHLFVDTTVEIPRALGLEQAHDVMDDVERAVRAELGDADVVVHAEPDAADEAIATTVQVVASRTSAIRGVHEIHVDRINGQLFVDCHVELDADLSLKKAHQLAQAFEQDLKSALDGVAGVTTHVEPVRAHEREAMDVTHEHTALVARITQAAEHGAFLGPRTITIKKVHDGLEALVAVHVGADASLTDAHAAAEELERRLLSEMPELHRVVVHVEPAV